MVRVDAARAPGASAVGQDTPWLQPRSATLFWITATRDSIKPRDSTSSEAVQVQRDIVTEHLLGTSKHSEASTRESHVPRQKLATSTDGNQNKETKETKATVKAVKNKISSLFKFELNFLSQTESAL